MGDRTFRRASLLIGAVLLIYLGIRYIWIYTTAIDFQPGERGICVAQFKGDKDNRLFGILLRMSRSVALTLEQISIGHNALMDWSSFSIITDPATVEIFQRRLESTGDPMRIRETLDSELVDIIARLIVHDALLLDGSVHEHFHNPLSAEAVRIAPVRFDIGICQTAADATIRSLRVLRDSTLREANFDFEDPTSYIHRFFHGMRSDNISVPRAIYYLELSRHLGLDVFLSYERKNLLKKLNRLLRREAFLIVSDKVNASLKKEHPLIAGGDVRMRTPAVVDLVIRRALERKITMEQSIIEVRNLEGAQQFRDLLAQIQRLLLVGDASTMLQIDRILTPLAKAAETWSSAADPRVRWMWEAKVNKLPWIGDLLEGFGIAAPAIPLKGKYRSYVQFVSEWYKSDSSQVPA